MGKNQMEVTNKQLLCTAPTNMYSVYPGRVFPELLTVKKKEQF